MNRGNLKLTRKISATDDDLKLKMSPRNLKENENNMSAAFAIQLN